MKKKPPEFIFLKDEPRKTADVSYKSFYHSSIAPALKKILKDGSSPHTIGLFGAWGTGKSTIIEMVQNDKELDMPVFIFDAWKYQEDTLRRTFLIKLVDYLRSQNYSLPDDILVSLYSAKTLSVAKQQKVQTITGTRTKVWSLFKKYMPFIFTILLLVGASVLVTVFPNNVASQIILQIVSIASGIAFLALFGKPIVEGVLKIVVESFFAKHEQQKELITEIYQEDRLNSPEQFEKKFLEILSRVDKKLIIVFDNIDRVQGDIAVSMLSTIKTFMFSGSESKIVFVVPCDPNAIEVQVKKYFHGENYEHFENNKDSFEASEYLRKIFNLILWVPEFINSDLEEYTRSLLKQTGNVSQLLDDEDVVLVINAAFSNNPREIIQFINNLIALIISVDGTKVKDAINSNIAYLAKVLVLRQKFPDAYERLKTLWFAPEKILSPSSSDETKTPLYIFMQNTSRITVDNAEPFIYFKDTADTRGVKNPTELNTALVSGKTEDAVSLAQSEDHTKLLLFISDQVRRYTTQERVLLNIVLTQFSVVSALKIDPTNKKYINDLMHAIDTSLWGKYTDLPIDEMFTALNNSQLDKSLKVKIIDRYITSLDTDEAITPIKRLIIDALRKNPALLSKLQKDKVRSTLESKYVSDEETLALFKTLADQESLITDGLISSYISGIDYSNIPTRLQTLSIYKDFIVKQDLLRSVIDIEYSLLNKDVTATVSYNENKQAIVNAVGELIDKFKPEVKQYPENLSNLVNELVKVYSGAASWEDKSKVVNALFWLEGSVSESDNSTITTTIQNYFQSWGNLDQVQSTVDDWNEETAHDLVRIALPVLLPRLVTDENVLQYIYNKAGDTEKSTIINNIISQAPLNSHYDINFISHIDALPDRKTNLLNLLSKLERSSWNHKQPYISYIASKIKADDADLKIKALEQIQTLVTSGDSQQGDVGLGFLNLLKLSDSEKRTLITEVLTWLREPGRSISGEHRVALQLITESYSLLQDTAKNDLVYFLFNLLEQSRDLQTIQLLVNSLVALQPSYKDFSKDFDDLLTRLQAWPDTQTKQHIYQELPKQIKHGRSKSEKQYWTSFDALYTQE